MSVRVFNIMQWMEEWAPQWAAWEKDNVGLQVGNRHQKVSRVLVTLDVTEAVVKEAIQKKADVIISHHPLIFRPLSSVTTGDKTGQMVLQLAQHDVSLFSAHTNLDFTEGGVSVTLAHTLGLQNIRFLSPLKNTAVKIAVFVPHSHRDILLHAMSSAGAGRIGEYSSCSFSTSGTGSFFGSSSSHPAAGKRKTLERVEEVRIEMIAPRARVQEVLAAIRAVHPYEEAAYDVYPLENINPNYGMGAYGTLRKPQTLRSFLRTVKKVLGSSVLRYTAGEKKTVQTVAVCGGAGSDLLPDAQAVHADVFITADVRYHTFHTAAHSIALVDAGHWETEQKVTTPIADRIRSAALKAHEPLTVWVSKQKTNPISMI